MAQQELNLALQYLKDTGDLLENWDGVCGELANAAMDPNDDMLYVDGDAVMFRWGWVYHMAMLRNGIVHDAWCPVPWPVPIEEWLFQMFDENKWITVAINGNDVYEGPVKDFKLERSKDGKIKESDRQMGT